LVDKDMIRREQEYGKRIGINKEVRGTKEEPN
jgi:hypothetical protein